MALMPFFSELMKKENIELFAPLRLSSCRMLRPYLLSRSEIDARKDGTVIMIAVPYYMCDTGEQNLSLYAVPRDYHAFFRSLFERVLVSLREAFPENHFAAFSDHSPIAEVGAAAAAGLGVVGKNHLLITEKYSSFVFLGEVITDIIYRAESFAPRSCDGCGACERKCPVGLDMNKCLSALSQKKGELSDEEKMRLFSGGYVWGCDICQLSCPHSKECAETPLDFFREKRILHIDSGILGKMTDAEFSERAFSWRGRDVIERNLRIFRETGVTDEEKRKH